MEAPLLVASPIWTASSGILLKDRRELSNIIQSKQTPFPEYPYICDILSLPPDKRRSGVHVWKRIGSDSSEAEVYLVDSSGIQSALKVMPILQDTDIEKNQNEIVVATRAGSLVLDRKSTHFPLVFGHGTCRNVTLFPSGKFTQKAEAWSCINTLRHAYPSKTKQINTLFSRNMSTEEISRRIGLDHDICISKKAEAHFLLSELADEDLNHWGRRYHSRDDWNRVINGVIEGVMHFHGYIGMCHNDLHLGNVLLLGGEALLHDFGKAVPITDDNWKEDYTTFLYMTERDDSTPDEVKDRCKRMMEYVVDFDSVDTRRDEDLASRLMRVDSS